MTISDIIILFLPLLSMLAAWGFRMLEQRLPEKQANNLHRFAKYAVQKVEQQFQGTSAQKKAKAQTIVLDAFYAAKLPIPAMTLIDAAIESFVYELGQFKEPPETEPAIITTGPIPIPPQPIAPNA